MNTKQIITFKTLDNFMEEHSKNSQLFDQLFKKKQKLLENVSAGKLDAKKYAIICQKIMNETKEYAFENIYSSDIKSAVQMELLTLDENLKEWFDDVLQQTKFRLQDQEKQYKKLCKTESPAPKHVPPPKKQQAPKPNIQKTQSIKSNPKNTNVQANAIYSLKLLDVLMDDNKTNKASYLPLFQQKQKLIKLMQMGKLNAKIYYDSLQKILQTNSLNQDSMFEIKMQVDLLKDLHDGNILEWFKDIVDDSGQKLDSQKKRYETLKSGKAIKQSANDDNLLNEDIDIGIDIGDLPKLKDEQVTTKENIPTQSINKSTKSINKNFNRADMFCFRYLDEQLQKNEKNPDRFCILFSKKLKIIDKMKNGELDGQTYRKQLDRLIQVTQNEDQRLAAETQIDFNDLGGDVMEFFENTVNETGQKYQEQEKLYKKYNKARGGDAKGPKSDPIQEMVKQSEMEKKNNEPPKPDIADIVSFTVIIQLLQKYKSDYDYCLQLKEKGGKLMKLVSQKRLGSNQYSLFLKKKIETSSDPLLTKTMKKQLRQLENATNQSKVFRKFIQNYNEAIKIDLGSRSSYSAQVFIDQNTINSAQPAIQIQFLIRKLGKYESLMVYYKKNKLDQLAESFKPQYQTKKKLVISHCQKIKKNEAKDFDVKQFAQNNLPDISLGLLQRMAKTTYLQKIDQYMKLVKDAAKDYLEYSKKLKKSANKNNIEQANKKKEQILTQAGYLQSLKTQQMIPLPNVEIQKVQMYNLDLNKHLSENDVEVIITNIQGMSQQLQLKIFLVDMKQYRFKALVKNGVQHGISTIVTVPNKFIEQIIKGTDQKYLSIKFYSKGWFSTSFVDEVNIEFNFIRNNIMEERAVSKQGGITIDFVCKVLKPKKPIAYQIKVPKFIKYPKYTHDKFIETQFLKSLLPYQKPSQSQLRDVGEPQKKLSKKQSTKSNKSSKESKEKKEKKQQEQAQKQIIVQNQQESQEKQDK